MFEEAKEQIKKTFVAICRELDLFAQYIDIKSTEVRTGSFIRFTNNNGSTLIYKLESSNFGVRVTQNGENKGLKVEKAELFHILMIFAKEENNGVEESEERTYI